MKIGMMRCSKIAFESGPAASADATPNNIKTACAGRVLKHVNVNRHQLMPKRKHDGHELAMWFCCSGIDKGHVGKGFKDLTPSVTSPSVNSRSAELNAYKAKSRHAGKRDG
ncbi:MAG TPA: hypothetical protein VFD27_11220 [Chthoniobacteraceae bacterium]|nr:hypothetical protein [Chthoniobacteraceae bacterium]